MQMYELQPLINNIHKKNKESWEQTRFLSYIIAQVNSTKKLNMKDILSFTWDEEDTIEDTAITNEDIERLRKKAQNYLKKK